MNWEEIAIKILMALQSIAISSAAIAVGIKKTWQYCKTKPKKEKETKNDKIAKALVKALKEKGEKN